MSTPALIPVEDIYADFLVGKVAFHHREESDTFHESLKSFIDRKYNISAMLNAVLYERIFATRLIRETPNPPGFVASKENTQEQFTNLSQKDNQILNEEKLSFYSITKALTEAGVIDTDEKKEYDDFYKAIRNPVVHGLSSRLFETIKGRKPAHPFEVDASYEGIYHSVAHMFIDKIYHLMTVKVLRKQ